MREAWAVRWNGAQGETAREWRPFGERGSGSVWVLAFAALIWIVAVTFSWAGGARAARHRAYTAADMAALSAASHAAEGQPVACGSAARIATDSGARLSRCVVHGTIADVTVAVPLRAPAGLDGLRVLARARAGPVTCTECR